MVAQSPSSEPSGSPTSGSTPAGNSHPTSAATAIPLAALGIPEKKTKKRKWLIALAAAIVIAAVAVAVVIKRRNKPVPYDFAQVHRGSLEATITATGTLSAVTQVDVGSEISGRIRAVHVDFNDRVTRGQVLAELDTTQLVAQLRQAQASLAQSRAQVTLARLGASEAGENSTRARELREQGLIAAVEQQTQAFADSRAHAQVQASSASTALAMANIEQVRANLSRATIVSPIDGMVLRRSVEPGQTVAAALQAPILFTLVENLQDMQLKVDIDEADIGSVHEGQEAIFHVDAYPSRTFRGHITSVRFAPRTVQNVVTYEAVISVQNSDLALRPGMTATASITTHTMQNVWLVPNTALRFAPPETGIRGPQRRNRDRQRGPTLWIEGATPNDPLQPLPVQVLAADNQNSAIENAPHTVEGTGTATTTTTRALEDGLRVAVDVHREATPEAQ